MQHRSKLDNYRYFGGMAKLYSEKEAGELTGQPQPYLSALRRGRTRLGKKIPAKLTEGVHFTYAGGFVKYTPAGIREIKRLKTK